VTADQAAPSDQSLMEGDGVLVASLVEDYGLLGDTQTAALVGRDGSIDWLCFPRFDGGAVFAALLGTEQHGRWLLTPTGTVVANRRRYQSDTLILETEMDTADGTVRLIDFMPPRGRRRMWSASSRE